jgi:hypothetical protein
MTFLLTETALIEANPCVRLVLILENDLEGTASTEGFEAERILFSE